MYGFKLEKLHCNAQFDVLRTHAHNERQVLYHEMFIFSNLKIYGRHYGAAYFRPPKQFRIHCGHCQAKCRGKFHNVAA